MVVGADDLGLPHRVGAARVLEEPELELQREDPRDGRVEQGLVDEAVGDGLLHPLEEPRRRHHHVVAGVHRARGGVLVVRGDPLLPDHPPDVVPVGDERARPAPLAAQHLVEQPAVDDDRYAVGRLVADHERPRPLTGDPLERRQEPRAQLATGDVRLGRVAPALRLGVPREVLGAREDRRRVVEAVALVAADHRGRELTEEERVLAEGLVHPAPAQVTGEADDGRERPVQAGGRDLDGGDARHRLGRLGVPRRRDAELGGEDRRPAPERVPVDGVVRDEQRDAQPGALDGVERLEDALRRGVEDRADVHAEDEVLDTRLRVELEHLAGLLGQRHAAQQVRDALRDRQRRVLVRERVHGCPLRRPAAVRGAVRR